MNAETKKPDHRPTSHINIPAADLCTDLYGPQPSSLFSNLQPQAYSINTVAQEQA